RQSDPAAFVGQEVDVIGFVYRDPRNASNQFWVSRFVVSCCVADASAIGLLVQADQASTLTLDSWVRVTGRLGLGEFAGERLPVIVPDTIEPTEQPEHPYLYP
ncbi:MAG: TIGR03943 family putative permease subunit, partial [Candidatus Roseilinea sp.]|uniref:TIGR03943 family putative permease subunit n=1 Tax=Candidatus Roseilinea sp. TaxID=2838777 RepID=UPI00404AEFA7